MIALNPETIAFQSFQRLNVAYDERYTNVTSVLRKKTQDIFLGDNRLEIDWKQENVSQLSNFAKGAHDRMLPRELTERAVCPL